MKIEKTLPLIDEILAAWQTVIGTDYQGYRNHVYRLANLCLSTDNYSETDKEKIQIAACFHDIGIWTDATLDYLPPSLRVSVDYLSGTGRAALMIEMHHRLRSCDKFGYPLVEAFRRADIADFSLGIVRMGLSQELIAAVKSAFPNSGFHKRLVQLGVKRFLRHPLNPLPMFRV